MHIKEAETKMKPQQTIDYITKKLTGLSAIRQHEALKEEFKQIAADINKEAPGLQETWSSIANQFDVDCPIFGDLRENLRQYRERTNALTEAQIKWLAGSIYQTMPGYWFDIELDA